MSKIRIVTERLVIFPFTYEIISLILNREFEGLEKLGYRMSEDWPHPDFIDYLPVLKEKLKELSEPTGFEAWIIARKEDGLIIGDAGFKGKPDEKGEIDIGYGFVKSQRRKGYGYEAVKDLVKWGLEQENVTKITSDCLINNIG